MALNLSAQTEAPGAEAGPGGTKVVQPPPESAPRLEEISRQFPQLEVLECLGRGGMGVVYKARQPRLNRFVALKILAREKEKDPRFAERFTREAQALARLNHPNIVTVYDFGETNGLYYLLMEYVDGMSLRQLLQTRKLAPEEALVIVPSICDALQYAHQEGIVHRDIKPENILLDKQGRVKIADFGIAKLLGADGKVESLTGEQGVVGTPHYMAPEQVEKPSIVDHRADIFSLGVVFYEMLTGELPLGKFAPPSRMVKMDVRLDEVVLHALEKEPERRYQQASQVKTDVETIAGTPTSPLVGGVAAFPGAPLPPAATPKPVLRGTAMVIIPAVGLIVAGLMKVFSAATVVLLLGNPHGGLFGSLLGPAASILPFNNPLFGWSLGVFKAIPGLLMIYGGVQMVQMRSYAWAIAAAILGIISCSIVGIPLGIWALIVLARTDVREAFGNGQATPRLEPAGRANGGGAWKVAAVIVAAVVLLIAVLVGALLLAVGLPAFKKARDVASRVQQQVSNPAPTFVVRGTVSDAVTGQPIAGARVDDNSYGTSPTRTPQQAWTDAQGHYELRTWPEEHTLAASAPGYQTKLITMLTHGVIPEQNGKAQIDFQLQPAEAAEPAAARQ
jgi:tRNA A-37 threonylcarbamoyl transferase component Bud32